MTHKDEAWAAVFQQYNIYDHNFDESPFELTAAQIKAATSYFSRTGQREVRILCKQDTRESRPLVFVERELFVLPVRNGKYILVRGEGYVDIPPIETAVEMYRPALDFPLVTARVGNSEMQHLDFAYANSIIRSFLADDSLVLTVRGRKYTPRFTFRVKDHFITVESVQTEVDAGYEGRNQVVLIEAKNSRVSNTIIRQLYYPYRQWKYHVDQSQTNKDVSVLVFEKGGKEYRLWQFRFDDDEDYNSIQLMRCERFKMM